MTQEAQEGINPIVLELQKVGLQPGLYFNLDKDLYHKDPALGSTDIRTIRNDARKFQKASFMTPKDKRFSLQTKATIMGTALHTIVLDGIDEFTRNYVRRPDAYDEADTGGKAKITRELNAKLLAHQELLHTKDYDLCLEAKQLLTEHKDLKDILVDNQNEVSVFWHHPTLGVPLKARFDILKPAGIGDIKTIENERGDPLHVAGYWAIKKYRYDIQAAHYMEGRRQFPHLVKKGAIYSGDSKAGDILNRPAAEKLVEFAKQCAARREFKFEFIFLQKSFPDVWARLMSPMNPSVRIAAEEADAAIHKFDRLLREHGTSRWPQEWTLGEFSENDHPSGPNGWG